MAKPKLTTKQAKFVRGIAEGKPNYVAALEAYDTDEPTVANAIAVENLQKPSIQEAIELARVKLNLTPERALKPIDDALNHEDLEMRLKGSDRALKIMGIANKGDGNTVNINFNQHIQEQRAKYNL
jgi:hypothetical protein